MQEQPLLAAYSSSLWVAQKSAAQLYIEHSSDFTSILRSEIPAITGLCMNDRNIAITNQRIIAIYKIPRPGEFQDKTNNTNLAVKLIHTFNDSDCMQIFIYDEILIVLGYEKIRLYSFGGIVLKEITFNDNEGMHFCSDIS